MELEVCNKIGKNKNIIAVFGEVQGKKSKSANRNEQYVKYQELSENSLVEKLSEMSADEIKQMLLSGDVKSSEIIDLLDKRAKGSKYISEDKESFKYIDKSVFPMPNLDVEREAIYVFGCSGSGKSYFTKCYAMLYKKYHPDNDIFVFSHIEEDISFDGMDYKRLPLTEELIDQIDYKSLKDSLVVFDDTNTPGNKELQKKIDNLKDAIAQLARHERVSAIFTTHMACDFNRTRILLAECTKFVIFPSSGGAKQQERMVVEYGGLDKKEFAKLKQLKSRWVLFNVSAPNYIVYQSGVKLLG